MQIGVTVQGFVESEGQLHHALTAVFLSTTGETGEVSGIVPFTTTTAQVATSVKQWILDSYGITVPTGAQVKIVGL
jgi:hypothetical protein